MKLGKLREQTKDLPDDIAVFIRCTTNTCGNITEAGKADHSTYGSFGTSIPCVIIEPETDDEGS